MCIIHYFLFQFSQVTVTGHRSQWNNCYNTVNATLIGNATTHERKKYTLLFQENGKIYEYRIDIIYKYMEAQMPYTISQHIYINNQDVGTQSYVL